MKRTHGLPALAGACACALVLAACNDDSVSVNGTCSEVDQTAAEAEAGRVDGQARVRVNIVSRLGADPQSPQSLRLGGVELFQGGRCVRLATTSMPSLGSIENDMGRAVADAALDLREVTHVQLLPASGDAGTLRVRADKIALEQPIRLDEGIRTELYLALEPGAQSGEVTARFVAAGPVPANAGAVMVGEPGRGGTMSTPGGFSLELGQGSLAVPTVYSVVEHDVGGVGPLLDVAPAGELGAAARVRFRVNRGHVPQGMEMSDFTARVGGSEVASTLDGNTVSMEVSKLGLMSMGTGRAYVEFSDGTRRAVPAGAAQRVVADGAAIVNNTCYQRLAANRSYYYGQVQGHAGVRVRDCEDTPPYVHIILVNMKYPNSTIPYPKILFPAEWYSNTNTFLLHTISQLGGTYGGSAFAAINGFYWDGDSGTGSGQTGTPAGMLYIDGVRKGSGLTAAEAVIGFTASYTNTGTTASLISKPAGSTSVSLGTYNWNVVPSTTSIVKNGACSRTSTETQDWNSWSALGFGNGILVMASSVSGQTTTAYELCSVFEGLNTLGGAIRLDGGPSAAIYWLGSHLNPLSGLSYYKYGNARHLAYAVAARQ